MADRAFLEHLQRELTEKGMLIQAGFVGYRLGVLPKDVSKIQLEETQMAFFAGAYHLYQSMMAVMDDGVEETPSDMRRMASIHDELMTFARDLELRIKKTGGSA